MKMNWMGIECQDELDELDGQRMSWMNLFKRMSWMNLMKMNWMGWTISGLCILFVTTSGLNHSACIAIKCVGFFCVHSSQLDVCP